MAILLQPKLALESSEHYVEIETEGRFTRGMTVVDRLKVTSDSRNAELWRQIREVSRPAKVVWKLDVPGWKRLLLESFS